jgi:folate-binding protein YgfZ
MESLALHELHASSGARFGELSGRELVASFSTPEREDEAARRGAALVDASYRDLLRIAGEDHLRFLQGMVTQDVLALQVGAAAPAALCTAKGALVADGELVRRADDVLFDLDAGSGARAKAALERFLVADDVELSDARPLWATLELFGPRARELADKAGDGFAIDMRLGALVGVRLYVPRLALGSAWGALRTAGAVPVGFDAREAWRIEAGVARFGQDMDEQTLPLEANLERAISYTKGCYVGQEVVARATYRGHVNWKLGALSLGPEPLPVGTELTRQGKRVGHLTSVARSILRGEIVALARLHRDALGPGTVLDAGSRTVTVRGA